MRNKIILSVIVLCLISTSTVITAEIIEIDADKSKQISNNFYSTNQEDIIISMLEQLNQEMMLGYIEELVEIAERHDVSRLSGTDGCEEARDYILNELFDMGFNPKILNWAAKGIIPPYRNLLFVSDNIEVTITGKPNSEQILVLMAHYDTTAITPSADDNSAGVAAVLSAAKILSQYEFNHEIRFVFLSGEEQGLLGSTAYAQNSYQTCESIVNVVNLDMIGYSSPEIPGDENKVRIYETCSDRLTEKVVEICNNPDYNEYINFQVFASDDDTGHGSDQRSFCNYGFDSIFIHEYTWNDNKDRWTDTIENMDVEYATRVARLAMAFTAKYGLSSIIENNAPESPSKVKGPKQTKINEEQEYKTSTEDIDGDEVYYMFDWDDGAHSEWIGPYESGEICTAKHTYTETGEYRVKAKAKDIHGIQSKWKQAEEKNKQTNIFLQNIFEKYQNIFGMIIELRNFLKLWT